jgi:hypothetical protein
LAGAAAAAAGAGAALGLGAVTPRPAETCATGMDDAFVVVRRLRRRCLRGPVPAPAESPPTTDPSGASLTTVDPSAWISSPVTSVACTPVSASPM